MPHVAMWDAGSGAYRRMSHGMDHGAWSESRQYTGRIVLVEARAPRVATVTSPRSAKARYTTIARPTWVVFLVGA
jgi:hypothetical protein